MPFGLTEEEYAAIKEVFRSFPKVEEILIFGSRALGTNTPGSDIDLAVKGTGIELGDILSMQSALGDLPLLYKFDVIDYASISNSDVIAHIDTYGIPFYRRE